MDEEKIRNNLESYLEMYDLFYHSESIGKGYTGLDLGPGIDKPVKRICFMPPFCNAYYMLGGKFQGSNQSMEKGYEDLYTISETPYEGWNEVYIENTKVYRFIRYLSPEKKHCFVCRLKFFTSDSHGKLQKLTGTPFGTAPSISTPPTSIRESNFEVPHKDCFPLYSFYSSAKAAQNPIIAVKSEYNRGIIHRHDFHELIYVRSGSSFHVIDNSISYHYSGDFILIPPGKPHTYYGCNNMKLTDIIFYPDMLPEVVKEGMAGIPGFSNLFDSKPFFCLNGSPFYSFHLNRKQQTEVLPLLETMARDSFSSLAGRQFSMLGVFMRLIYILSTQFQSMNTENPSSAEQHDKHEIVNKVICYLQENYSNINNIQELTGIFGISYRWLAEIFTEETGLTMTDHLNRIRIGHACQKILKGNEQLTRIAFDVGFRNYNSFIRLFKDYIGCPPLKLANMLGIIIE